MLQTIIVCGRGSCKNGAGVEGWRTGECVGRVDRAMLLAMSNAVQVTKRSFGAGPDGALPDGSGVELFTVVRAGIEASFTNFGARLVSLRVPDRRGVMADVVLGFPSLGTYVEDRSTFLGAVVGRYGNRIAGGRFALGGEVYRVPQNDGDNALHGGAEGFDRRVWEAEETADGVRMTLVSPDGDQGFPGTLRLAVRYVVEEAALRIEYEATCDRDTVVNVTNHAYFNLAGESSGDVLGHELMLPAERMVPVSAKLIPTGELMEVAGTPFDFRQTRRIGERIDAEDVQLERAKGYDHTWASGDAGVMKLVARLREPASGRVMEVETTEPGVQFYTGNFLDGTLPNREGGRYGRRSGLCLETQHYPDSPNQPGFPTTELRAGERMRTETVFRFGVDGGAGMNGAGRDA